MRGRVTGRALLASDWWLLRKAATAGTGNGVLPLVTRAADGGKLWLGVAGVLALTGRRGRSAAVQGLVATGAVSLVVNGPLKRVARRPRPAGLPAVGLRRFGRSPRTSSFPSGHTASAAAFTVAAGAEAPAALIVLGPLAATVAWSRLSAGRHFPGDVVGGAGVGVLAGLATRRLWRRARSRRQGEVAGPTPSPSSPGTIGGQSP
jgi:undecaprenyl-diphosphatase